MKCEHERDCGQTISDSAEMTPQTSREIAEKIVDSFWQNFMGSEFQKHDVIDLFTVELQAGLERAEKAEEALRIADVGWPLARSERDQLAKDKERLVGACRPFALYAEYHDSYPGYKKNREDSLTLFEHWHYEKDGTSARITAGHLRTLAALLTELEERKRE